MTKTKSIRLDEIPRFIIKISLTILLPLLDYISDLSIPQQHFPTRWTQAVILPVYKKGTSASVQNCKPAPLLKFFQKFSSILPTPKCLIILNLNSIPVCMVLLNLTILLPIWWHIETPVLLVCSKCQTDSTYFEFSNIFDSVLHTFCWLTLSGPVDGYASLLHSYIILAFKFTVFIQYFLNSFLVFPKDLSLGSCSSMCFNNPCN